MKYQPIYTIIATAWCFYRKHTNLNSILPPVYADFILDTKHSNILLLVKVMVPLSEFQDAMFYTKVLNTRLVD